MENKSGSNVFKFILMFCGGFLLGILALIGYQSYIGYNSGAGKVEEQVKEDVSEDDKESSNEEINKNDDIVKQFSVDELKGRLPKTEQCAGYVEDRFVTEFFSIDGINISNVSKNDLIVSVLLDLEDVPTCQSNDNIQKKKLTLVELNEKLMEKYNDKALQITLEDIKKFSLLDSAFEIEIINSATDIAYLGIYSTNCDGCSTDGEYAYLNEYYKSETKGNKAYLYFKAVKAIWNFGEGTTEIRNRIDENAKNNFVESHNIINFDVYETAEQKINWSLYGSYIAEFEIIDDQAYFRKIHFDN